MRSERVRIVPACQNHLNSRISEKWGLVSEHRTGRQDSSSANMRATAVTRDMMSSSSPNICDR